MLFPETEKKSWRLLLSISLSELSSAGNTSVWLPDTLSFGSSAQEMANVKKMSVTICLSSNFKFQSIIMQI